MKRPKPNPVRDAAVQYLCDVCLPGSTVYTLSVHRPKSGLSERIRCFVVKDGAILDITSRVALAIDARCREGVITVRGGGLDRGFEIVHALSYVLHGLPTQTHAECGPDLNQPRAGYTLVQTWL